MQLARTLQLSLSTGTKIQIWALLPSGGEIFEDEIVACVPARLLRRY